jgi:DNA-binding beta-propeller fold protein YncE
VVVLQAATGRVVSFYGDSGRKGSEVGQLHWPRYLAVWRGKLFVSDMQNARVQVLDAATGRYLHTVGAGTRGSGATQFAVPNGLAVLNGSLYVADPDNGRISVFDAATGEHQRMLPFSQGGAGYSFVSLDADQGRHLLYASVHGRVSGVHVIEPLSGRHIGHMGDRSGHATLHDENGALFAPTDVSLDEVNGFVYVLDSSKGRVNQYAVWRE